MDSKELQKYIDLMEVVQETLQRDMERSREEAEYLSNHLEIKIKFNEFNNYALQEKIASTIINDLREISTLDSYAFNAKLYLDRMSMILPAKVNDDISSYIGTSPALNELQSANISLWLMKKTHSSFEPFNQWHRENMINSVDNCIIGLDTLMKIGISYLLEGMVKEVLRGIKKYRQEF